MGQSEEDTKVTGPVCFQQADFTDDETVFHGFFGRRGGVSRGVYSSLNCGYGSNDDPERVGRNRQAVADVLESPEGDLLTVYQEHGAVCLKVEEAHSSKNAPKADTMVTDKAGLALGVLTADCAPVLFCGEKADGAPVIGAAHAGWRGALGGVLSSTVQAMEALGAEKTKIKAAIGPCIGKNSYEVGEDFAAPFMAEDDENERFFTAAAQKGHLMFDLAGYCAFKLFKEGLSQIYIKDLDTYFNEEDFFSYRRATHRDVADYGRQISVVMIKARN